MAIDYTKSFDVSEDGISFDEKINVTGGDSVPTHNAPQGSRYYSTNGNTYRQNGAGVGNDWIVINSPVDLPSLQIRRTTSYSTPNDFTDVTFDAKDIESDDTVIEHDDVNSDRVLVKETGLYLIGYSFVSSATSAGTLEIRVRKNDTTVLSGGDIFESNVTTAEPYDAGSRTFISSLTSGDFLSLQAHETVGEQVIEPNLTFFVIRLKGVKGDQGATGSGTSLTMQNNGTPLANTPHTTLNFDTGLTVTDEGSGVAKVVSSSASVFGSNHQEESSYGDSSTTSSTAQTKLTLTTPTVPAGLYRLGWYYEIENSSVTGRFGSDIRNNTDSVTLGESDVQPSNTLNDYMLSGYAYVTFSSSGSKAFSIRYWNHDDGTATIRQARLEFWRIS